MGDKVLLCPPLALKTKHDRDFTLNSHSSEGESDRLWNVSHELNL